MPTFSSVFWIPLCSSVVLFVCKHAIQHETKPFLLSICKDQHDKLLNDARATKASLLVFKNLFYITMSAWAYIILKDTEIFPTWLGGTGSLENCFKEYPFAPQIPGLLTYSLVQMGYYIEDIIDHNFYKPKSNDFWEMNLHHLCTYSLYAGMIMMNTVRIGALISFAHSFSDIFGSGIRLLSQTVYKTATVIFFFVTLAIWIISRNIVIPVMTAAAWRGQFYP